MQRAPTSQFANSALVNLLGPYFTPGSRVIDEVRLVAPVASVTFANIPQFYRDLETTWSARTVVAATGDNIAAQVNGIVAGNYDWIRHYGAGGGAMTIAVTRAATWMILGHIEGGNSTANTFAGGYARFYSYALGDRYKRVSSASTTSFGDLSADAELWLQHQSGQCRSTNAITSVRFRTGSGSNLATGTIITLRGLL